MFLFWSDGKMCNVSRHSEILKASKVQHILLNVYSNFVFRPSKGEFLGSHRGLSAILSAQFLKPYSLFYNL